VSLAVPAPCNLLVANFPRGLKHVSIWWPNEVRSHDVVVR
jgi:hypothetical protein